MPLSHAAPRTPLEESLAALSGPAVGGRVALIPYQSAEAFRAHVDEELGR